MTRLAVVCGLRAEAKIARSAEIAIITGGGDAPRVLAELDALAPSAVLSFGVAGGLAPGLAPGTVRIARAIVAPDSRRLPADPTWSAAMGKALGVPVVTFAGVEVPVADVGAKAALRAATLADLVDMESHVAADWALRQGARFAALRVITDCAERALPHAATVGMRADGRVDVAALLASLIRHPTQLPELIRTGLDARTAFATLFRCRQRLGPRFALLDL